MEQLRPLSSTEWRFNRDSSVRGMSLVAKIRLSTHPEKRGRGLVSSLSPEMQNRCQMRRQSNKKVNSTSSLCELIAKS